MLQFLGRRLALMAAVALAIIFFGFLGMGMAGNSERAHPNYDPIANGSVAWSQTISYLRGAIQGDFGAVQTRRGSIPVSRILVDTYGKSLGLLLAALSIAVLVGLVIGTWMGLARRSLLTLPLLTVTALGISLPSFFAALLLQVANIKIQQSFQIRLAFSGGFGWDKHLTLPVLVLAARPIAHLTRATYLSLRQVMEQDYIRTAWSKGLSRRLVLVRHALRNVGVPILTAIGVSLRFSLGSLPVVEYFFAWPGVGVRLLDAIRANESQVVVTLALSLGLTFMFVNLVLDLLYRFVDPRLKQMEA